MKSVLPVMHTLLKLVGNLDFVSDVLFALLMLNLVVYCAGLYCVRILHTQDPHYEEFPQTSVVWSCMRTSHSLVSSAFTCFFNPLEKI